MFWIRSLLIGCLVTGSGFGSQAYAETEPVTPKPGHEILDPGRETVLTVDEQRKRDIAAFERWRAEIFDYDRRLYERVKKLNNTNVELRRMVGFSSAIIIVMLGVILFYLIRRRPHKAEVAGDTVPQTEPQSSKATLSPGMAFAALDRYQARRLLARQKKLMRSVEELTPYLQEFGEDGKRLAKTIANESIALQSDIDAALTVKPEQ